MSDDKGSQPAKDKYGSFHNRRGGAKKKFNARGQIPALSVSPDSLFYRKSAAAAVADDPSVSGMINTLTSLGYNSVSAAYFKALDLDVSRSLPQTRISMENLRNFSAISNLNSITVTGQMIQHSTATPVVDKFPVECSFAVTGWYTATPVSVVNLWIIRDRRKLDDLITHINYFSPSKMSTFFFSDSGRVLLLNALKEIRKFCFCDDNTLNEHVNQIEVAVYTMLWFCTSLAMQRNIGKVALDDTTLLVCVMNFILTSVTTTTMPIENLLPSQFRQLYSNVFSSETKTIANSIIGMVPGFTEVKPNSAHGRSLSHYVLRGTINRHSVEYIVSPYPGDSQLRHAYYWSLNGTRYYIGVSPVGEVTLPSASEQMIEVSYYIINTLCSRIVEERGKLRNYSIDLFEGRGCVVDDAIVSRDPTLSDIYERYCYILSGSLTRFQILQVIERFTDRSRKTIGEMYQIIVDATSKSPTHLVS